MSHHCGTALEPILLQGFALEKSLALDPSYAKGARKGRQLFRLGKCYTDKLCIVGTSSSPETIHSKPIRIWYMRFCSFIQDARIGSAHLTGMLGQGGCGTSIS